ncbi:MAG: hypothetical protein K2H79_05720, partial [Bacteroidaceae bacterium]|nr:hypothetical protein [Bacteroidaceae bacterium]
MKKLIISIIAFTFFNAVSVMNAQSLLQRNYHRLDSVRLDRVEKASLEILKKVALEIEKAYESGPISYEQTISELEKEEKDARLKRINEEIETYKRLVSQEVKNTTPTFGLGVGVKASTDTCYIESKQITEVEGNKSYNYTNASTEITPLAYAKTTFSSQREILDFIKSIDFDRNPPTKKLHEFYNNEKKITEDKVLRKGIELYQKEKIKKAVNYFSKISTSSKYSKEQRDYAEYQVAHYNYYGKFDIYYN